MNYAALREELTTDPAALGYDGMEDAAAAAVLNGTTIEQPRRFYATFRTLADIMPPDRLERLAAALKATMPTIHEILSQPGPNDGSAGGVDLTRASVQGQLAALSQANDGQGSTLITAAELEDLNAFAVDVVSRAALLGLGEVNERHVRNARA